MGRLGSYDIVRQIGEGGFGKTYEGRHILNPNIKACLKQNINITDKDAKLLMREAQLLSKIHHHSLPAFRDLYKAPDGSMVLAMSHIEGKTLDHYVQKHKALHPEDVSWISQRTLNALGYLHAKGVVHGDVKPPNLTIQPKKHNAILLDYGLSAILPKGSTIAKGYTPVFGAPEMTEGKPPIPESDIYSLGLTLIYALGGDPVSKSIPIHVPSNLAEFVNEMVRMDPLKRPNPQKTDLVARLSDIRYEAFGRRHSSG